VLLEAPAYKCRTPAGASALANRVLVHIYAHTIVAASGFNRANFGIVGASYC